MIGHLCRIILTKVILMSKVRVERTFWRMNMKDQYYLKVLKLGICPCCKKYMRFTVCKNKRDLLWKCENPDCKSFQKERFMPYEAYQTLCYLENNQPDEDLEL